MSNDNSNGRQNHQTPTAVLHCPGYLTNIGEIKELRREVRALWEHSDQRDEEGERERAHLIEAMDRFEQSTKDEIGKVNRRIDGVRDDLKRDIHDLGESISHKIDERIEAEKGAKAQRILTWILTSIVGGGGIIGLLFYLVRQLITQLIESGGTP